MHKLPGTDILVSELTLGTMNFGQQVSKDDAYAQMDLALKYGINSIVRGTLLYNVMLDFL